MWPFGNRLSLEQRSKIEMWLENVATVQNVHLEEINEFLELASSLARECHDSNRQMLSAPTPTALAMVDEVRAALLTLALRSDVYLAEFGGLMPQDWYPGKWHRRYENWATFIGILSRSLRSILEALDPAAPLVVEPGHHRINVLVGHLSIIHMSKPRKTFAQQNAKTRPA